MFDTKRNLTYHTKIKLRADKQTAQTTKILVLISTLFIIAEFPIGIYFLLTGMYGSKFFWKYIKVTEILLTLTHVLEGLNFVVYFSLSPQFRKSFMTIFHLGSRKFAEFPSFISTKFSTKSSTKSSTASIQSIDERTDTIKWICSIFIKCIELIGTKQSKIKRSNQNTSISDK